MATGLVIHISSGADHHTEILTEEHVRIGSAEGCDVRLRSSNLPEDAGSIVVLELIRSGGSYLVADFEPSLGLTRNGNRFENGAEIDDGDEIRASTTDLAI